MSDAIPATLGTRVAHCRNKLGWKQSELAERAGISVTFLSEVENDKRTPGAEILLRLAEALGVTLDYLMKGAVERTPTRGPLVLPRTLYEVAEEEGWSVGAASDLLKLHNMVVARRSKTGDGDPQALTKDEWKRKYEQFFGKDAGG